MLKIELLNFRSDTQRKLREIFLDWAKKEIWINDQKLYIIYIDEFTLEVRKELRALHNSDSKFIIVSPRKDLAYIFLQTNAIYFLFTPTTHREICRCFYTLTKNIKKGLVKNKFYLTYNGSGMLVDYQQLLYVRGSGNYSRLVFEDEKEWLVTKKLNEIERIVAQFDGVERIGKSYILNLNRIKSINKWGIAFNNKHATNLVLSKTYSQKLKEKFYWTHIF